MSPLNTTTKSYEDITTKMSTFNNITTTKFIEEISSNNYANMTSTEKTTTATAPKTYTIYYNIIRNYHIKTTAAPICPAGQTVNSNEGCSPIFVDL